MYENKNMAIYFYFGLNIKKGLEEPLTAPLECKCLNCWCFYNEIGVHFKCHPGWKGDLCEINTEAQKKALIIKFSGLTFIVIRIQFEWN